MYLMHVTYMYFFKRGMEMDLVNDCDYTNSALFSSHLYQGAVIEGIETSYFLWSHAQHRREVMRSTTSEEYRGVVVRTLDS